MSSYIEEVNEGEKRRNQMSLNQSSGNLLLYVRVLVRDVLMA